MAEKKNSPDDLQLHSNEPHLSHSPEPSPSYNGSSKGNSSSGGLFGRLQNIGWVKKNPNAAKGAVVGILLVVLLVVVGWQLGWFGGGANPARNVAAQPQQPLPPAPGQPPVPDPQPQAAKPAEKKPEAEAKKEEAPKEEIPALPNEVMKWKKPDYYRARKENHPKLLEAVAYLGEKFRGSDPAAQGLTDLLKPLPPEEPAAASAASPAPGQPPAPGQAPAPGQPQMRPGQPQVIPGQPQVTPGQPQAAPGQTQPQAHPRNPADNAKLVEAIIAALGENGSETARRTFEQVLSGKLTTDDDKVAVEATLKTLVAHPCLENDMLLLRVLMTPEAMRPADREGPWPAKELWTKAFELSKQAASPELRAKLAEALAERLSKLPPNDPIREFLLAQDPLNGIAQAVLYEKASSVKELRLKLEQQLADYSALALGRLLGIPEGKETGSSGFEPGTPAAARPAVRPGGSTASAPTKDDPTLAPQLAGVLWSEKFRTLVETPLADMKSLERQTNLIVLAATIPHDSTRVALARLLRKRWNDGPKLLETAGLFDRVITDPALQILLKLSPRKDSKAKAGKQGQPPARQPPAATTGKMAEVAKANQKKEQAEQDWLGASSKLTAVSFKRFHAAALAKERADEGAGKPAGKPAAPILPEDLELNEGAKPVTSYHMLWPDDVAGKISGEKPSFLEIFYVRAEELNRPRKAVSYYARQLQTRVADARTIDNKAIWIDGMRADSQSERRRSMDVWITRADNKAGEVGSDATRDDEETDLIIEVLVIEIKDPVTRETLQTRPAASKDD